MSYHEEVNETSVGAMRPMGVAAGLSSTPRMDRPRGEIELEFKNLNIVTSEMLDVVAMLDAKLGPILAPDMPIAENPKDIGLATGLASEVRKNTNKVSQAIIRMRTIIDRVQL